MKTRPLYATLLLAGALLLAGFSAGFVWMTHMHHLLLPHVADVRAYDASYEALTDNLGVPLNAVAAAGAVALLVFRHPRVPWWLPAAGLLAQAAVWVSRIWMWGDWAETVRAEGALRADGSLHPAQAAYVGSHGIRIALLTGYALIVLASLVTATVRSRPSA
ncbi:hypothetical protein [Phytomonospora endophytica]|uniref:DUF1772 domain-containing protein n=1 Tax=Phytomonospora endophytica TaxID=714109 RepID=A0A841G6Y1_9ACTN|nr:hypothetical protein [Phytomonospora endophytica]MBB6039830.1 hypothetical protein [Phytomonospora endophytica]GIG70316.1 hypothetical protein Pen01_66110 [Phytomonospora endophytica]